MKEIEIRKKDTVKTFNERQIEKQQKYLGSAKAVPGHILWEYNVETQQLNRAKMETVALFDKSYRHKVIKNPNCLYFYALNERNAKKRILKSYLSL